jgi:hypothetical protein
MRLDFVLATISILVLLTGMQIILSGVEYDFLGPLLIIGSLAFFVAIVSIVTRFSSRISMVLAMIIDRIRGRMAARIGVRALGRRNANVFSFIMLFVLIVSMLWTTFLVNDNAGSSYLSQSRFSIGGDVTIKLDSDKTQLWDSFIANVSTALHEPSLSTVIEQTMFLSANLEGAVSFYSIDPLAYSRVGYNYEGMPIENTPLKGLLESLDANISGAIVTQDVADEFQLSVGGSLRGFLSNGTTFDVMLFTVVGIVSSLPEILVDQSGYISPLSPVFPESVGSSEVWVNNAYASRIIDPKNSTASYLCIRVNGTSNVTRIIDQIRASDTHSVIDENGIAVATLAADNLLSSEPFRLSSSHNILQQVILLVSVPIVTVLLVESVYGKSRTERHIQFALGYSVRDCDAIATGQSVAILLFSSLMTLIVTPVLYYAALGLYIWGYYPYLRGFPELFIVSGQVDSSLLMFGLLVFISISYFFGMAFARRRWGLDSTESEFSQNNEREVHV